MKLVELNTNGGKIISAHVFDGDKTNSVLIIAGAMGTKQTFYSKFAEFISQRGITVITFDYRGIGQSLTQPVSVVKSTVLEWGCSDLESVLRYTINNYPEAKVNLLGHSVGGQLIGLAPSANRVSKIILVAAQSGYWKFWKGISKYKMWVNWYVLFPFLLNAFGYMPAKRFSGMENLPSGVARQWRKWCISSGYLFDDLKAEQLYFSNISCHINSYSCSDDIYAPKEAVDWLTGKYENAIAERIHLVTEKFTRNKIGHFGFFKSESQPDIWELLYHNLN